MLMSLNLQYFLFNMELVFFTIIYFLLNYWLLFFIQSGIQSNMKLLYYIKQLYISTQSETFRSLIKGQGQVQCVKPDYLHKGVA